MKEDMNHQKKKILALDDSSESLFILKELLSEKYTLLVATNPELATKIAREQQPDLILLDIIMPKLDGFQICRSLKEASATKDIPIIFLTSISEASNEAEGLLLGASDYITKPFSPAILHARISTQLTLQEAKDFLKHQNALLEEKVSRRTAEINIIQDVAMLAVGTLAESRDNETGNHIRRTQDYMKLLAQKLKNHPRFRHYLSDDTIRILYKSAPLHDIGKVGIPDRILLKPGKLTDAEMEIMKTHTTIGRDALITAEAIMNQHGHRHSFLHIAKEIAGGHQEKWDGSGYPEGLSGEDIPIAARLMAVADVYDALISDRVYKKSFSQEKSLGIMREGHGSHFDPDILDAFLESADEFESIRQKYSD